MNSKIRENLISPREALERIALRKTSVIDVRSETEFHEGSIPGAKNIPILVDPDRVAVGTCYKKEGREAAIALGYKLVLPKKAAIVKTWANALAPDSEHLLFCARGGMRSRFSQEWLAEAGHSVLRVQEGLKGMRKAVLDILKRPFAAAILGGLTGSGKSRFARALAEDSDLFRKQWVDLELLANHSGSAFGKDPSGKQMPQINFENGLALATLSRTGRLILEDESRSIGRCRIPDFFYNSMIESPLVFLEVDLPTRALWIWEDYVMAPTKKFGAAVVGENLKNSLDSIAGKLGNLRYRNLRADLLAALDDDSFEKHRLWIEPLLTEYYDPMYRFAMKRKERRIAFSGRPEEVREYFLKNL